MALVTYCDNAECEQFQIAKIVLGDTGGPIICGECSRELREPAESELAAGDRVTP